MIINKNKSLEYIILIIIIVFFKKLNVKTIIFYNKNINRLNKNNIYLKSLLNNKITTIKKNKNRNNPKVSLISPIYNRENFILRFLKNIQMQSFYDLEIIFIDDCSMDNSVKLIKEYQKIDERLILIKNKKNKGTFISRNIGVLYSNSKYIKIPKIFENFIFNKMLY